MHSESPISLHFPLQIFSLDFTSPNSESYKSNISASLFATSGNFQVKWLSPDLFCKFNSLHGSSKMLFMVKKVVSLLRQLNLK